MGSKQIKRSADEEEWYKDRAIKNLRIMLPHGSTVYTLLRKEESRNIGGVFAFLVVQGNQIRNISAEISDALKISWHSKNGIRTSCAFSIIMQLSYLLHGTLGVGRQKFSTCHNPNKTSATNFKAGYTLEHKTL